MNKIKWSGGIQTMLCLYVAVTDIKCINFFLLMQFWNGLTRKGRQEILEVDKQTFLEQARKSMVCSRCYGILVDEFSRIIVFGNSTQQDETVDQDPSKHPWGCLTATRDGTQKLTLLDHYFSSTSLKGIQKVITLYFH